MIISKFVGLGMAVSKEDLIKAIAYFKEKSSNINVEDLKDAYYGGERKLRELESKIPKPLNQSWDDIKTMILMTKDYCTKEYKGDVPWGTISAIVAALIYFVSPFDVVPDFMAGIGYVDDAAVIKLCMDLTKEDLNRYRIWKKSS